MPGRVGFDSSGKHNTLGQLTQFIMIKPLRSRILAEFNQQPSRALRSLRLDVPGGR